MKLLRLLILLLPLPAAAQQAEQKPLVVGETLTFRSVMLDEDRQLNIYLPEGYIGSNERYPVIYVLDGSMDEDFMHIGGLVQFASFDWIQRVPKSIVVGIANVNRKRDFTFPSRNAEDKKLVPASGGSAKFIEFLEKEALPLIEKNYRVDGQRTLIGQSLGGLVSTEILLKKPQLFNNYIIVSPSLWWDKESLLEEKPVNSRRNVYIAVGNEGDVMEGDAQKLAEKMKALHNVNFETFSRYTHADILHFAVYEAFGKLFPQPADKK